MLAGPRVLDDTAAAYAANADLPFARRLIAAMQAGEAAGGDKRGKQSAALVIHGDEEWSELELRVDDHADPLAELARLEQLSREHWVHFRKYLPSRRDRVGTTDRSGNRGRHRGHARRRSQPMSASSLLEIERLKVVFHGDGGRITHAVDAVDLNVARGTTLGLVGESGCGKSVTSLAVMGLLPSGRRRDRRARSLRRHRSPRPARPRTARSARQPPRHDLPGADDFAQPELHGRRADHRGDRAPPRRLAAGGARAGDRRCCGACKFRRPSERIDDYPHKLSGGMRQRVMIAMALACDPQLLIADEPTTALDVTIQAQILDLLRELKASTGAAIILITHDLGVVAEVCDEVAVMYAGRDRRARAGRGLFERPAHPYTVGLLGSIPRLDRRAERLATIEGMVPDMTALPAGCRFAPRCPFAEDACRRRAADRRARPPSHWTRCCPRADREAGVVTAPAAQVAEGLTQAFRRAPLAARPADAEPSRRSTA